MQTHRQTETLGAELIPSSIAPKSQRARGGIGESNALLFHSLLVRRPDELSHRNEYVEMLRQQDEEETEHAFSDASPSPPPPPRRTRTSRPPREEEVLVGPDEQWTMDSDDLLEEYGLGVYAIVDKFSGKMLSAMVLPIDDHDNLHWLYLSTVRKCGGLCPPSPSKLFGKGS